MIEQTENRSAFSLPTSFSSDTETPFAVSLDFFSGPMDLLLHLVHQQEVSIENVKMSLIAEQYLRIVSSSRFVDLEKAAEYLVIAAELLAIKSARLIPSKKDEAVDESLLGGEDGEQFYEALRARLRAYAVTKERAKALIHMPQLGFDTFSRFDRSVLQPTPEMLQEPENSAGLGLLFARLIKRIGGTNALRIHLEPISVVSFMVRIVDALGGNKDKLKTSSFSHVLGSFMRLRIRRFSNKIKDFVSDSSRRKATRESAANERGVIVGSFIAILELAKRGLLSVSQMDEKGDIHLSLKLSDYGGEVFLPKELTSEFDSVVSEIEEERASTVHSNKVIELSSYRREIDNNKLITRLKGAEVNRG